MVWQDKVGGSTWWCPMRLIEIWVCSGERMRPVLRKPLVGSRLSLPFRCGTVCPLTMMLPWWRTFATASQICSHQNMSTHPRVPRVGQQSQTWSLAFIYLRISLHWQQQFHSKEITENSVFKPAFCPLIESIAQLGHCLSWHCLFGTISSHVGRVSQCQCITISLSVYVCMSHLGDATWNRSSLKSARIAETHFGGLWMSPTASLPRMLFWNARNLQSKRYKCAH